ERFTDAVEEGHRALLDAVGRLSASADALEGRLHWSIEALETAINTMAANAMAARAPAVAEHYNGSAAGVAELRTAVEMLTTVLERLTALPEATEEVPLGTDSARRPKTTEPRLARELRR